MTRVAAQLTEIPNLLAQLSVEVGSAPPDPDARTGTTSPARPPLRLEVVDLLDRRKKSGGETEADRDVDLEKRIGYRRLGVIQTLWLWVALIDCEQADQGTINDEPTDNATAVCSWLIERLPFILEQHGDDFERDVAWMHRDLQRSNGIRPPIVLKCPMCGWRIEGMDGDTWFRCTGCPKTWRMDAELRRLGMTLPPMTLRELSRLLSTPLKNLYRLHQEGRFMPVGTSPRGGKMFDPDVVKRAMEKASEEKVQPIRGVRGRFTRREHVPSLHLA